MVDVGVDREKEHWSERDPGSIIQGGRPNARKGREAGREGKVTAWNGTGAHTNTPHLLELRDRQVHREKLGGQVWVPVPGAGRRKLELVKKKGAPDVKRVGGDVLEGKMERVMAAEVRSHSQDRGLPILYEYSKAW